jgi:pimeloyl-ACP methyl ester carboxylesterase
MALADEIIPNAHTRRLYESLPEPKRLWEFEGAGHNSWPSDPSEAWWSEVMSFLAQNEARQ